MTQQPYPCAHCGGTDYYSIHTQAARLCAPCARALPEMYRTTVMDMFEKMVNEVITPQYYLEWLLGLKDRVQGE